ncbi:MAG: DUF1003 domain-containing protein [Tepidiformaceae bacterium]
MTDTMGLDTRSTEQQRANDPVNSVATVVEKNIAHIAESRRQFEEAKSMQDRAADRITWFSGSMLFVYLHVAWFAVWILVNLGWLGVTPFDEFPFGLLTMVVSLEAIFLSTFVLISQNRSSALADKRADLDLQINLLSEREATKLLTLLEAVAKHVGVTTDDDPDLGELKKEVNPTEVLDELARREATDKAAAK